MPGRGVGLALLQQLVEKAGARLRVMARRHAEIAPFVIPMNRDSYEAHLVVRMERAR